MKKLALLAGGCGAVVAMAVLGAGPAAADAPDVTGETYGTAVQILKYQGYKPVFAGSIGKDLPQSQCLVIAQDSAGQTQRLRLDCKLPKGQEMPDAPNTHRMVPPGGSMPTAPDGHGQTDNRPTPGAGTVTVTPRPVG